jgi:SAM-dependent methyltransferase
MANADVLPGERPGADWARRLGRAVRPSRPLRDEAAARREAVTWAYRVLLDRDPEGDAAIAERVARWAGLPALRDELLESDEFRSRHPRQPFPALLGNEPPLEVEAEPDAADLRRLFDHVQATWQHLGEADPHWSVLTAEHYRADRIAEHADRFYESGRGDVARLLATLDRNGVDARGLGRVLEFGCGVGRLTRWLAEAFRHVHGVDISRAHLAHARSYLDGEGVANVALGHLATLDDLDRLPRADLVYSVIVLQHNPPPVIRHALGCLLRRLNPGGVACIQLPTYRPGYHFRLDEYLARPASPEMEMHVLPQREVFEVLRREGCTPLEVLEDTWTGPPFRSNTFVVRKAVAGDAG